MSAMFLLIICSLTIALGFLLAFIWAVRHGQFEDRYTPSVRILFDDQGGKTQKDREEESSNQAEKQDFIPKQSGGLS
jgi:cbb3-type cytochrome oxidase maturation protein